MSIINTLADDTTKKIPAKKFTNWASLDNAMRIGGFTQKQRKLLGPMIYGRPKSNKQLLKIIKDFRKDSENKLYKESDIKRMKQVLSPELSDFQKKRNIRSQKESTRLIEEKLSERPNNGIVTRGIVNGSINPSFAAPSKPNLLNLNH